jgi:hypothetical protein
VVVVVFHSSVTARSTTRVFSGIGLVAPMAEWSERRRIPAIAQRRTEFNDDGTGSKVQRRMEGRKRQSSLRGQREFLGG